MCVTTKEYMAHMDDMARHTNRDRLAYVLSVPIWAARGWVMTPWVRLEPAWTPDTDTAVLFAQKMVQHGACLAVVSQNRIDDDFGWVAGSLHHPGRCSGLTLGTTSTLAARRRSLACYSTVYDAMRQRTRQARRWERRKARVCWVLFSAAWAL
jgi:hypothetical protein